MALTRTTDPNRSQFCKR